MYMYISFNLVKLYYSQLKQSEETREAEMTDVNELTAEFTQRLTDAEMRVSSAIKV